MSLPMYPYTNMSDTNLDWIIRRIKELTNTISTFTALQKIKWCGNWDISKAYEQWSIVDTPEHDGYISIKPVPIGVNITDTNYWVKVCSYDVLYAAFELRISDLENKTNNHDLQIHELEVKTHGYVTPEMYGAIGDGVTDDTDAIQNALNNNKVVLFTQTYAIDIEKHIKPNTDNILILQGATLFALPASQVSTSQYFEPIIDIINANNVCVIGNNAIINGNRYRQPTTPGTNEWASGIRITNANNIKISGLILKDCHGDGIEIYANNNNIIIDNIICDNNYRQGLTIGGVNGCVVTNSIFKNTNGTDPSAGIDVEVESSYIGQNITIDNCAFEGNKHGILVGSKNHSGGGYTIRNVSISNCSINDSSLAGLRIECKDACSVSNCTIKDSNIGLWLRECDGVVVDNLNIKECDNIGCQVQSSINCKISNSLIENNTSSGVQIGQGNSYIEIIDNTIHDNGFNAIRLYSTNGINDRITIKGNYIYNNMKGREYTHYGAEIEVLNTSTNVVIADNIVPITQENFDFSIHEQTQGSSIAYNNNVALMHNKTVSISIRDTLMNLVDDALVKGSLFT